eukprot:12245757-Ditylum_brightwellii.AAC.1
MITTINPTPIDSTDLPREISAIMAQYPWVQHKAKATICLMDMPQLETGYLIQQGKEWNFLPGRKSNVDKLKNQLIKLPNFSDDPCNIIANHQLPQGWRHK